MNLNLNDLMGKFHEMQSNMQRVKEQLDATLVEGESGGGMVKAVVSASKSLKKISIDPSLMDDREMLEDLITAAVNKAMANAEEKAQQEMAKITQGMMPPGMDLGRMGF
jgi:hypothetical protein